MITMTQCDHCCCEHQIDGPLQSHTHPSRVEVCLACKEYAGHSSPSDTRPRITVEGMCDVDIAEQLVTLFLEMLPTIEATRPPGASLVGYFSIPTGPGTTEADLKAKPTHLVAQIDKGWYLVKTFDGEGLDVGNALSDWVKHHEWKPGEKLSTDGRPPDFVA